ncbi:hypothetical protein LOAG_15791 [Loa loa]|uniref:Protein kish n=1 Tax=Loa loa TaxID=7209 RepID=A0A1S0TFQ3_LOALO|nr:hypothetical protein LOAG_15791 [Loa loa]EFO12741.2 hypothetical protein LOAG_15791 [Loa loa]
MRGITYVHVEWHSIGLSVEGNRKANRFKLSALFNFQSLISVLLLLICTCTYIRTFVPKLIDRNKEGITRVEISSYSAYSHRISQNNMKSIRKTKITKI